MRFIQDAPVVGPRWRAGAGAGEKLGPPGSGTPDPTSRGCRYGFVGRSSAWEMGGRDVRGRGMGRIRGA